MPDVGNTPPALRPINSLEVDVVTDDVSDTYVSKTLFAVSEFANVIMAGAKVISGEALLYANLGLGLRLKSKAGTIRHTLLFDTGPEGPISCATARSSAFASGRSNALQSAMDIGITWLPFQCNRCDRQGGRRGRSARQSRNVQRARDQVGER